MIDYLYEYLNHNIMPYTKHFESYTNGGRENNFVSLDILGVPYYFRSNPKLVFPRKTVSSKSFSYYFPHNTMKYCLMEMY